LGNLNEELKKRRVRKRREATRPKVKPDNTFLLCETKGSENVILVLHSIDEERRSESESVLVSERERVCNFVGVLNYERIFLFPIIVLL
jgi:hypothetical protein